MKNNIDVFYFSTLYPLHILFVEDGKMGELGALCHVSLGAIPAPGTFLITLGEPPKAGGCPEPGLGELLEGVVG